MKSSGVSLNKMSLIATLKNVKLRTNNIFYFVPNFQMSPTMQNIKLWTVSLRFDVSTPKLMKEVQLNVIITFTFELNFG